MPLTKRYKSIETLHENSTTLVYRAQRLNDSKRVILKVLKPSVQSERTIANFANEQTILSSLKSKYIVRLLEANTSPSEYIHVFEDINAQSLYDLFSLQTFGIDTSLDISLSLARAIDFLHQNQVLHTDINPKNIIYNPDTKALQLIDFGQSVQVSKISLPKNQELLSSGNLFYMAPEQTGLTQGQIDYRSDLYSLGMSLYHLFLGHSPFDAKDRYELLHQQIAFTPPPLHELNQKIPRVLSKIISKLMEKKPESRYQSTGALIYDLTQCIKSLKRDNTIDDFEIASRDYQNLDIGVQLFGRDKERAVLQQMQADSLLPQSIRVLISGHSGVGKTRLAEEFLSYFSTDNTNIIKAKPDQFQTSIPYFSLKQLFSQLHTLIMSQYHAQDTPNISVNSARLLHFVFPELRDLFPSKNSPEFSSMNDIKVRLPLALKEFFHFIATQEHPLVIFIDDLQWADASSVELIQRSLLDMDNPYIHFIGCFRDNEIEKNEEAQKLVQNIKQNRELDALHITLLPLSRDDLVKMFQELFSSKDKRLNSLATIIYDKTGGNPFYVTTFVHYLIDEKELSYKNGKWAYSLEKIQAHDASINIAKIITKRFSSLNYREQSYLQHLSLLGSHFDLKLGLEMMDSFGYSTQLLADVQRLGFIHQNMGKYQFVHDQIQTYIFNSIDEKSRRAIHLKIGKYLEKAYKRKAFSDIISVVYHLNNAYTTDRLPKRLFKLNLLAIEEMIKDNAYLLALEQCKWVKKYLCNEQLWKQERSKAFLFRLLKARILYLNALPDMAYEEIKQLMPKAVNLQERLSCFKLLKEVCVTQGKHFKELLDLGGTLLEELKLKVPEKKDALNASIEKLNQKINSNPLCSSIDEIITLPLLKGTQKKCISCLLVDYWESAYYLARTDLMQWACLNIINTSFKHGNSSESSFGYVVYGTHLISQKEYKKAALFGEVALKLNHIFCDEEMLPKIHNYVANFINPYTKPLVSNVPLYQKSLKQSRRNGDIVFGTWANLLMHLSDFFAGTDIDDLRENITNENSFIRRSGDIKMIAMFDIFIRNLDSLQDINHTVFKEEEQSSLTLWENENFYPALAWYAILKAQECFLQEAFEKGLSYLQTYVHTDANEVIMFPKIRLHFIRALLLLGKYTYLNTSEQELLKADLAEFDTYTSTSPRTFKFERLLLKSELMKATHSHWDVAKNYDACLQIAQKNKNHFFISLAGLCAGRFFKDLYFPDLAQSYFHEAVVGLNRWGAYALSRHLKEIESKKGVPKQNLTASTSESSWLKTEPSNFQSLLKSFHGISQAQDNNDLIHTLIQTIAENATASRAVLILKQDEHFRIRADVDFKTGKSELHNLLLEQADIVPISIISYAINSAKTINLHNPSHSGKFQFDTYIQEHKPVSCLAIPTLLEGSLKGLLYIENTELITPLSQDTIRTLKLLLTQAVIVFQNTSLYERLKRSKDDLTMAQKISHVGSWQFNSQNETIIWSAETYRIYELEPFSIDIDGEWFFNHVHPDDVDYVAHAAKSSLDGESYYDVTHRIILPSGKEKIVHQRAEVFLDNGIKILSGTIQDITEAKRSEELISHLSQVVDQNPYSTIITDINGNIEYINARGVKMTGYTKEELLGKNMNLFRSYVHTEDFYNTLWKTIKEDRAVWNGTLIDKVKDESLIDCESTIFPLFNTKDEITNFVTIQNDVTQRNIKDKLFLMQSRQAQMGEMLSMIAHQWRQPLSIIAALMNKERVKIILNRVNTDDLIQNYDEIEAQISHLSDTISDFRDFFKPNKQAIQTKSSTIISKALALVDHALEQKNIQVTLEYIVDSSYKTFENEVQQVILSLISNAQDAFHEHKVLNPRITIVTDEFEGDARISIEDNAQGIDSSIMETLFLPYVSTKDKRHGTGLGLYMSKTIIEEHCHGSITVENTELGARFTLRIPLKETHDQ